MADFPSAETVSAQWLTAQLHRAGIDADVTSFTAEQIGTGQIGKCLRFSLEYAGDAGPATLIGKFPSDDPASRATGVALQNFLKEVSFYRELQPRLSIRTPLCYAAEIEGEGPNFVVLMEDLAPARQGDQLLGCSPRIAAAAVNELVGLHAPSWCDESLHGLKWLRDADAGSRDTLRELYAAQLPGFLDRYGEGLTDDEAGIIARVASAPEAPLFAEFPDVFSLVHVDYRLDNLMIHETPERCDITAVDWQSITLGAPLNDVAYFLGAGLVPETRAREEQQIVRGYHQRLLEADIAGFDWETCWEAYRRGVFAGFGVTVIASMLVQRTARGDEMFTAMARRHARHALDLGGDDFLA